MKWQTWSQKGKITVLDGLKLRERLMERTANDCGQWVSWLILSTCDRRKKENIGKGKDMRVNWRGEERKGKGTSETVMERTENGKAVGRHIELQTVQVETCDRWDKLVLELARKSADLGRNTQTYVDGDHLLGMLKPRLMRELMFARWMGSGIGGLGYRLRRHWLRSREIQTAKYSPFAEIVLELQCARSHRHIAVMGMSWTFGWSERRTRRTWKLIWWLRLGASDANSSEQQVSLFIQKRQYLLIPSIKQHGCPMNCFERQCQVLLLCPHSRRHIHRDIISNPLISSESQFPISFFWKMRVSHNLWPLHSNFASVSSSAWDPSPISQFLPSWSENWQSQWGPSLAEKHSPSFRQTNCSREDIWKDAESEGV